jgi:transposase
LTRNGIRTAGVERRLTVRPEAIVLGQVERFNSGRQVASSIGPVPGEESNGDRQRLGHISRQGNTLLDFLMVEAAQAAVRGNPEFGASIPPGVATRKKD